MGNWSGDRITDWQCQACSCQKVAISRAVHFLYFPSSSSFIFPCAESVLGRHSRGRTLELCSPRLFSKPDPPPQMYIYRKSLPYIAIINRDGAEKATKMQGSRFATAETKSSNKVDNVLPLRNECCIKLIHPRWLSRFDDWDR